MPSLELKYQIRRFKKAPAHALSVNEFQSFSPLMLDIGNVSTQGAYSEALAAAFDLEGFTAFCNQIDPHLVIPEYLSAFLRWLFDSIKAELSMKPKAKAVLLWSQLPFFAKFTGDGALFLWSTRDLNPYNIGNIVISLENICNSYASNFLPTIKKSVAKAPSKLRCGIARGQVVSIGNGRDYVGACINVASRIQKFEHFTFAFSKRGIDSDKCFEEGSRKAYELIKASIRDIGDDELIYVPEKQFKVLKKQEQRLLRA